MQMSLGVGGSTSWSGARTLLAEWRTAAAGRGPAGQQGCPGQT